MSTNSFFYFLTFIFMCTLYNMNCRKGQTLNPTESEEIKKGLEQKKEAIKIMR